MNPFFSIIVPVYNVEKYLNQCIDSVLTQSFLSFELILVDDGSADGSSEICDAYSLADSRVKSIHIPNSGASGARNVGLDNAQGEYIIFLDSDDFYNRNDALQILYDKIAEKDAQIVIFGCTDWNIQTNKTIVSRTGYKLELMDAENKNATLHYLLSEKMIPGGPTIFAVKRNVIEDNNIRYHLGIRDEDYDFVLNVFMNSDKIFAVDTPFYTYRHGRSGSVTGSGSIKMIYGIEYTLNKWLPAADEMTDETIKSDLKNYLAFIYSTGFVVMGRMNRKQRKKAVAVMKKYKYVLNYAYWLKPKIAHIAVSILGYNLFSVLSAKYFSATHVQ